MMWKGRHVSGIVRYWLEVLVERRKKVQKALERYSGVRELIFGVIYVGGLTLCVWAGQWFSHAE